MKARLFALIGFGTPSIGGVLGLGGAASASACIRENRDPAVTDGRTPDKGATRASRRAPGVDDEAFAAETASPSPSPLEKTFAFCGAGDARLERVAERVARREARGEAPYDAQELSFALRAAGEPHVWPHDWTLSGPSLNDADTEARLRKWLASFADDSARRCGIGRAENGGNRAIAVVVVDAAADLAPLPTRARVGQWLRFEATLLEPSASAKLVVLGPRGAPRTVPTTVHGDVAEATFAPDMAGPFTVQLLASFQAGPRPVLEAAVFADVEPSRRIAESQAPGEDAAAHATNEEDALVKMIDAARATESLAPLRRSDDLDRIALGHARAMQRTGRLGHDAGDGEPDERLRNGGISFRRFGENVARAANVVRAHRVLWASPSHRENVLDPEFAAVGVGIARDASGEWVCEIFADFTGIGTGRPVQH